MTDELDAIRELAVADGREIELLQALGDRADRWAAAFCAIAKRHGHNIDEGWMIGWFANAIEHSYDTRTNSGPVVLPDGSAFFVGKVGKK